MSKEEVEKIEYELTYFSEFDFEKLKAVDKCYRPGGFDRSSYNNAIIMLDTETSKSKKDTYIEGKVQKNDNYVVAWTLSIRAYSHNICTLYGNKPSDLVQTIKMCLAKMKSDKTIMYVHNLSYDWVFLRKFLFEKFGTPIKQLNTKPHYPINIEFCNGLILKDSLILAQRSLEKWAKDLDVEHKKAKGKWDYDLIRHQDHIFSDDELEYIEHDTLAGVECLDVLMHMLNKRISFMPYTATGIPREETRKRGKIENAHERFLKMAPTFEIYIELLQVFHGGYTHGNRHLLAMILNNVQGWDKSSSYPSVVLTKKFPMERFTFIKIESAAIILDKKEEYAFIFKLTLFRVRLKSDDIPMPALQFSKCVKVFNAIQDNGRILCADYIEIYLNEIDFSTIYEMYDWDGIFFSESYWSYKDYLPRWFTDYIYQLYKDKTELKGKDPILYNLQKAKLNAASFGMIAQKSVRDDAIEDYESGEYDIVSKINEDEYQAYLNNKNSILPYQWGCWVTSYAMDELFKLGKCADIWLYSDTDSVYGKDWNKEKLKQYNEDCLQALLKNGYEPIIFEGKTYIPGVAELDSEYTEFKYLGAKRYCGRSKDDNELHITVAGVPKKGASCLKNDISNFREGFIFDGKSTGKKQHTINHVEKIYINEYGDEVGDSINLSPGDYLMSQVKSKDWMDEFFNDAGELIEEVEVQSYDEDR